MRNSLGPLLRRVMLCAPSFAAVPLPVDPGADRKGLLFAAVDAKR